MSEMEANVLIPSALSLSMFGVGFLLCFHVIREFLFGLSIPGPFPYPIIGNILQIGLHPHFSMAQLALKYGDVFKIKLGPKQIVVVNNFEAIKEGLSVKDKDFAGRPSSVLGNLVSKGGRDIVFADAGETWKLHRWIAVTGIRKVVGPGMNNLQEIAARETSSLVERFCSHHGGSFDPYDDIRLAVTNVISGLLFGKRYGCGDSKYLEETSYISSIAETFGNPEAYLLETSSLITKLPLKSIRKLLAALKTRDNVIDVLFEEHEGRKSVQRRKNFIDFVTDPMMKKKYWMSRVTEEPDYKLLAFDLLGAGLDTTVIALQWALIYLILWPKVQEKAHRELDRHFTADAIIQLQDKGKVPYIECVVLETLRMCSLFPIVPRKSTVNTSLKGYHIPQGTEVVFNLWSANHDPNYWHLPHEFIPERFLDEHGSIKPINTLSFFPFSSGCRSCPGEGLAKNELFLIIGRLLQIFRFEASGSLPSLASTPAVAFRPLRYSICAKVRNKDKVIEK